MKKFATFAAFSVIAMASASQAALVAGWDFQTTTSGGTAAAAAPNAPSVYNANVGAGTIYLDGSNGSSTWVTATASNEVTSFAGTAVNTTGTSLSTTTSGTASLALLGGTTAGAANGKSVVFSFDMTGLGDLVVSYATQRTGTGFTSQAWDYSTDGTNWTSVQSVTSIPSAFGAVTLSTITGLDNSSTAFLRLTVTGVTSASGNNRLDNIQLNASAIPEPAAMGLLAPAGLALVARRRR